MKMVPEDLRLPITIYVLLASLVCFVTPEIATFILFIPVSFYLPGMLLLKALGFVGRPKHVLGVVTSILIFGVSATVLAYDGVLSAQSIILAMTIIVLALIIPAGQIKPTMKKVSLPDRTAIPVAAAIVVVIIISAYGLMSLSEKEYINFYLEEHTPQHIYIEDTLNFTIYVENHMKSDENFTLYWNYASQNGTLRFELKQGDSWSQVIGIVVENSGKNTIDFDLYAGKEYFGNLHYNFMVIG